MGDMADQEEALHFQREADEYTFGVQYNPRWFLPSSVKPQHKKDAEKSGHVCKDWPCAFCGKGF